MKIILLGSYPRSGNSFVRTVLQDIYGIPTFSVYPENRKEGQPAQLILHHGHRLAWNHAYDKRIYPPEIAFVKTHNVQDCNLPYPAVHIVRDGRDAIVSFSHFLREVEGDKRPLLEIMEMLIRAKGWLDFVMAWSKGSQVKRLVRFEKLLKDPVRVVSQVGDVAGLKRVPLKSIKLRTFEEFQAQKPNVFRRGIVGSWKDEMPKDMEKLFWAFNKEAMDLLGYK